MKIPAPVVAIGLAALVLLVGTALLQRGGSGGPVDVVASTTNGQPRGLLLLSLLLSPTTVTDTAALTAATAVVDDVVVLVPPPEHSAFSAAEGEQLRAIAERGARVVVACDGDDDRNRRLTSLLAGTNVACRALPRPETLEAAAAVVDVTIAVDGLSDVGTIELLDRGRVHINDDARGVVALVTEHTPTADTPVVVSVGVGRGEIVVVGSMSVFANDGLGRADNARLLERLLAGRARLVVDERHHRTRLGAVVGKARLQGPGPLTALVCALLLLPLTLLGALPRRGERLASVDNDISDDVGATTTSAHPHPDPRTAGLAAMLVRAGLSSRTK